MLFMGEARRCDSISLCAGPELVLCCMEPAGRRPNVLLPLRVRQNLLCSEMVCCDESDTVHLSVAVAVPAFHS